MKIGPFWNSKNQGLGQGADQEGLTQPRHALQQAVPAHEQTGQHPVDDLLVSDNHPGDLLADGLVTFAELPRPLLHLLG